MQSRHLAALTALLALLATPAPALAQPPAARRSETAAGAPTGRAPAAAAREGAGQADSLLGPALALLKQNQQLVLDAMANRSIQRGLQQTAEVQGYLRYIPLGALVVVPLWMWRRHVFRRARERGVSPGRAAWRGVIATLLVTALLWGFIQIFLFVEEFKRYFSWTSPTQGLAGNAITYLVERGDRLGKEGTLLAAAVHETVRAVALGERRPEAIFGHLFDNARRVQDTWAFRFGYQLYAKVFPLLEYFGTALLFVMFVVFLRYAIPGVQELLSHVSGEGPPGVGFGGSLWRNLRVELFAMTVFLGPYLGVVLVSFLVTWMVTSVAAQGLMDNAIGALTVFYSREVNPALVAANFLGIALFVIEIVLLLLVATALILSNWLAMLHHKFRSRRSFWTYRRFVPHIFGVTFRLYATLLVPAVFLAASLDWLGDTAAALGEAGTLLVPVTLALLLNLALWYLRFPRGLRNALDDARWLPPPVPTHRS